MNRHDDQSRVTDGQDTDPGALVYTGDTPARQVSVTVVNYDGSRLDEQIRARPEDFQSLILRPTVTWINVDGVYDTGVIQAIGDAVGIHPLTREDIVDTHQRPKIEDYGDYLYVAIRMLSPESDGGFRSEQVSLVLGSGYVLSFQEQPGDVFERIRERLRAGVGRIRTEGADYLFYALLDAIIDGYFAVIEVFGERIEGIEEEVVTEPDRETLQGIYALKRSLIALRRAVWPLRDVVAELERGESPLILDSTLVYLCGARRRHEREGSLRKGGGESGAPSSSNRERVLPPSPLPGTARAPFRAYGSRIPLPRFGRQHKRGSSGLVTETFDQIPFSFVCCLCNPGL